MTPSHTRRLIPVLLLLGALAPTGACTPSARKTALKTSLVSLDAAREGFVQWDKHKQTTIVADATSLEDGKTALTIHRNKRAPIIEAFTLAYSALALAALDDNSERLTEAINAAASVYRLIKAVTGKDKDK